MAERGTKYPSGPYRPITASIRSRDSSKTIKGNKIRVGLIRVHEARPYTPPINFLGIREGYSAREVRRRKDGAGYCRKSAVLP